MKKIFTFWAMLILLFSTNSVFGQIQIGQEFVGTQWNEQVGKIVALSGDGNILAMYNGEGIKIYRLQNNIVWEQIGQEIERSQFHNSYIQSMILSEQGNRIALGVDTNFGSFAHRGTVKVYEIKGNNWQQIGTDITGEDAGDVFGYSISFAKNGNRIAVGAPYAKSDGRTSFGRVKVYDWKNNDWQPIGSKIEGEYGKQEEAGHSVSLSEKGDVLAVGFPASSSRLGKVKVFKLQDDWTEIGDEIIESSFLNLSNIYLGEIGYSVSLSADGNKIAVGAPGRETFSNAGHIAVFKLQSNKWSQIGLPISGEWTTDEKFGSFIQLSSNGNRLSLNSLDSRSKKEGKSQLYELKNGDWVQLGEDIITEGIINSAYWGGVVSSMSNDGSRIIIGTPYISNIVENAGRVCVYDMTPVAHYASGNTFIEKTQNCELDAQDISFPNVLVKMNYTYRISDAQGKYVFPLPEGTHLLESKIIDNDLKKYIQDFNQCDTEKEVVIEDYKLQDPNSINFGYKVKPCAYLKVDIENTRRRRCFMSSTTVEYQNKGFATASNVEVKVEYPDYIRPITSSVNWTKKEGNTYFFTIGNLNAGEVGKIVLQDSVVCGIEEIRGLTQCVTATISPANSCGEWTDNENNYAVSGRCAGAGIARFVVSNRTSTSLENIPYRLFADSETLREGTLSLSSLGIAELEVFSDAKTIRIEVFPPNHNRISASVEGCQTNTNYLTKTQAITQIIALNASPVSQSALALPQDDGGERMEKSCSEIIDSYDPNDKQVTPFGLTRDNLIEKTTELDYLIRFQNTGTDTAYRVVVLDTLSTYLDIETIRLGMSSHNYRFFVDGNENLQVLRFEFENINLPDSNTNEPASNGFIKFKINQKANNSIGTVIKNRAAIYFDFNSPIITNSTSNKVAILPLRNSSLNLPVFNCSDTNFELVSNAGEDIESSNQTATLAAQKTGVAGRWSILEGLGTLEDASKNNSKINGLYPLPTSVVWSVSICSQTKSDTVLVRSTNENYTLPITYDQTTKILSIPTGNVTYQWYKDGIAINGQAEATLNLSDLNNRVGIFTVVVSANGESITSEPFVIDAILSNEELIAATEIIAYPNPTESILNIELSNRLIGSDLRLVNVLGITMNQTSKASSKQVQLKVDNLPNGIYFVQITSKYGVFYKKVIIKR